MNQTIIFITALYRYDNLVYMAKNINKINEKWKDKYNIIWLICKDVYNGYGNLDNFFDYISTVKDLTWQMYDSGKPNQKNYGGSLFNLPLKDLVTNWKLENPWVYVYDDDNLIHQNLMYTLDLYYQMKKTEQILVLNIMFDEGYTKILNNDNVNCGKKYLDNNIIPWIDGMFIVDPSAVILKYSIIEKYNFYAEESTYDFNWLFHIINTELKYFNNIVFSHYLFSEYSKKSNTLINSYHNLLTNIQNNEIYDKSINDIDNTSIDIMFSNYNSNINIHKPVLSNNAKLKIIEILKEDNENFLKNN